MYLPSLAMDSPAKFHDFDNRIIEDENEFHFLKVNANSIPVPVR